MDIQQLCQLLQKCTSYDPAERKAAEAALTQVQHTPGFVVNLLRVATEASVDLSLRQVASITFKNLVKKDWDNADKPNALSEDDKVTVRSNLTESIIMAPPIVRSQLLETARAIIYEDFPDRWPGLMQQLYANLTSQDQARVYGALSLLRVVCRKYEFKDEEDRAALQTIVQHTFPVLLTIFQALLATESPSTDIALMLKLVCKVFWSSTYMAIPQILVTDEAQFVGWMSCLHTLLLKPVPAEGQPVDPDERARWPWWKCKKWAMHIAYRQFSRYGEPKLCSDRPGDRSFSERWAAQCSVRFLEAHMALMSQLAQGSWMSPRTINLAMQYLTHALAMSKTYKLMKPHMHQLLVNVVFPLCCFTDEDQALWEEDPQEYIRKGYDILEDMYSPKTSAMNFIHELCKTRGKGNLEPFMAHLVGVLNEHAAAGGTHAAAPVEVARRMDGALLAVGALQDVLTRKDPYKKELESLLGQYVLPLFASPHGHLRAKACWMAGTFADVEFAKGRGRGPVFNGLLESVIARLRDADLPVKVDAVVALRSFVDPFEAEELAVLQPLLPQLCEEIFKLMGEVEGDDLVSTLEVIVEKFGEQMAPYAVGVTTALAQAFWRSHSSNEQDEAGDDDMASLAMYGCLRAICTLLESVSTLPHLFPQLEEILFPIMDRMLSTDGQDVFEEVVQMASYFTYFSPEISMRMWGLWPKLHSALMEWAIDYFDNILVPLDNFISRGTEVFLSSKNPDYLQSANQMVERALRDENLCEKDVAAAPQLLSIILQNCRGQVDNCVEPYLVMVLARLQTAENLFFKDQLVCVVANALYYNPAATLAVLQRLGAVQQLFATWFGMIVSSYKSGKSKHFRRQFDKKVCILGLASLLVLPDHQLPPEVSGSWGTLMQGLLSLLAALKRQQEEEQQEEEDSEEEEEGEDDVAADEGLEDDEDELLDDGYLKRLAKAARDAHGEEDSEEEEWTEDEEVQTPIDPVDPFVFFADALAASHATLPARAAALGAGLDPALQQQVAEMVAFAQHQRSKAHNSEVAAA